jgi:hypothetical protein
MGAATPRRESDCIPALEEVGKPRRLSGRRKLEPFLSRFMFC